MSDHTPEGFFVRYPEGLLKNYIQCFWYCYQTNTHASCLSLPLTHIEMVINLSDDYYLEQQNWKLNNADGWISGYQSKPFTACINGRNENIGVLFKPAGLKAFFKNPIHEFTNSSILFDNLESRKDLSLLRERLWEEKSVESKFDCIEAFFKDRISPPCNGDHYLNYALTQLEHIDISSSKIEKLAKKIGVSRKALYETFKNTLGISPVRYRRLYMFNTALKKLCESPAMEITELAFLCGYYDSAHFIKEFISFSGISPGYYRKLLIDGSVDSQSGNFIQRT